MTRKRLSDLVREEVNPAPESESVPTNLAAAEALASETPIKPRPRSRATKTDLEGTVTELTAALEATNQRANELQNQVAFLESELAAQKKLAQSLQLELQQASQMQAALEEQKVLVGDLHAKLQQAQALESELEEQKQLVRKLYAELQQAQQNPVLENQPEPPQPQGSILQKTSSYAISSRPIGYSIRARQPSPILSNEEIGWFD